MHASDVRVPTLGCIECTHECTDMGVSACMHTNLTSKSTCSHVLEARASDDGRACGLGCTGVPSCACTQGRPRTSHLLAFLQLIPTLPNSKISLR